MTQFTDFTQLNKLKGARIAINYKETDNLIKSLDADIEKAEGSRGGKVIGHTKTGKAIYGKKWIPHSNVDKIHSQHPEIEDPHYAGRTHIGPGITRESQIFNVKAGDKTYLVHSSPYDGDFWYEKDDNVKKSEPELQQAMTTGSTPGKETATKDNVIIKATDNQQAKMKKVMDEWKAGTLKTSVGEKVTDHKQAIAIGLSEAGLSKAQATGKELDELIQEHKDLISILESPSHKDDKEEAEEQKKELKQYEGLAKAFETLGMDDMIEKAVKGMIGEIRTWGGKKYKKQANGKWLEVSEHGMTKQEHKNTLSSLQKDKSEYKKKQLNSNSASRALDSTIDKINKHKQQASKLSDKEHSDEEVGLKKEKIAYDKTKHLDQIVQYLRKDKRRSGWSTMDIRDAGEHLGIDVSKIEPFSHEDEVIKLTAVKDKYPNMDFSKNKYWKKEAIDEVFRKPNSKHISDMSKEEKHSAAEKMGVKGHKDMTDKELDKHLSDKNVEKQVKEFKEKKESTKSPEFKSAYGDMTYSTKNTAISAGEKLTKPENYTLLEHDGKFITTTNKRAGSFMKEHSDIKMVGKFLPNGKFAHFTGEIKKSVDSTDLQKAFETLGLEELIEKGGQGSGRHSVVKNKVISHLSAYGNSPVSKKEIYNYHNEHSKEEIDQALEDGIKEGRIAEKNGDFNWTEKPSNQIKDFRDPKV